MIIVLDSNQYYSDMAFNKEHLTLLKDLGSRGKVSLHIPWFVYNECITKSSSEIESELTQVLNKLTSLDKKGLHAEELDLAKNIIKKVERIRKRAKQSNARVWEDFLKASKAKVHPFNGWHSEEVFTDYFDGAAPFKSLKSRSDIPDAYIYKLINELAKSDELLFVCSDKNLGNAFSANPKVKVVDSFTKMYEDLSFSEIYNQYRIEEEENLEERSVIVSNNEKFKEAVEDFLRRRLPLDLSSNRRPHSFGMEIVDLLHFGLRLENHKVKYINGLWFVPIVVTGAANITFKIRYEDFGHWQNRINVVEATDSQFMLLADYTNIVMRTTVTVAFKKDASDFEVFLEDFDSIWESGDD